MAQLSRVVWHEGMHLAQHHFQLQSRYLEDSIRFALSHLFFEPYGLAGCELDAEALRNGTVAVVHARGVMRDGLAFHIPASDPPPAPLHISDLFSPTHESHLVLLAIPPYRSGASNCSTEPGSADPDLRYSAEVTSVLDETTGEDEMPVHLGRKNFRLLLDIGHDDGTVSLPLARVRRDGAGHFIYDPEYVPPCLQIGASERLMELLRRIVDVLDAKSEAIASKRQASDRPLAEQAQHEVMSFWLSHAIHSSLPPLRHHLTARRTQPAELYAELARLAGALCTFSLDAHPRTLPRYSHEELGGLFAALDRHIRTHLELVAPTHCVTVPLRPVRAYFHTGSISDKRCLGPSQWIIGVRSPVKDADVASGVPRLVKICSADHLARVVKEARAALPLEHLPHPPVAVSPRSDTQYFNVQKEGPCWKAIAKSNNVGAYVPSAIEDPELELLIVLESGDA